MEGSLLCVSKDVVAKHHQIPRRSIWADTLRRDSVGFPQADTCSLRRIVIGPRAHNAKDREDIVSLVEMLLQKNGIQVRSPSNPNGVEIALSLIPYRSV